MKIQSGISALLSLALLTTSVAARADVEPDTFDVETAPVSTVIVEPTDQVVAVTCGLDKYQNRVAEIKQFGRTAEAFQYVPGIVGGTVLYIIMRSGGGTFDDPVGLAVVGGAVGLIGVSVLNHYIIKGFKAFKSRHYTEVAENIMEAQGSKPGTSRLEHTAALIKWEIDHHDHSADEVGKAVLAAVDAGDLCGPKGKLLVTDAFRRAVSIHLQ
jgi:hypothetical protein